MCGFAGFVGEVENREEVLVCRIKEPVSRIFFSEICCLLSEKVIENQNIQLPLK